MMKTDIDTLFIVENYNSVYDIFNKLVWKIEKSSVTVCHVEIS